MSKEKVQVVEALIYLDNEKEYVVVGGRTGLTDTKHLIQYLRKNLKKDIIRKGKKINKDDKLFEPGYNKYCFERYDYNENTEEYDKSLFIVKFKTSEKSYHYETYKSIEDLLEIKRQKLKVNRTRVTALLGAGIILLSVTGPTIVKEIGKIMEKELAYGQDRYSKNTENLNEYPLITEEEKQQALEEYYKDLEVRAKSGDKEAIEEYSRYVVEQQLKEEAQEYKRNK